MIDSFEGKYRFLSNFAYTEIEYEGLTWPTSEHAFQAMKTLNHDLRVQICNAATPNQAKKLGRKVTLRSNWDEIKDDIMLEILRVKFSDPDLADYLIRTHPHELVEGNWWGDRYWGKVNGQGKNMLGQLLMKVRTEIIERKSTSDSPGRKIDIEKMLHE